MKTILYALLSLCFCITGQAQERNKAVSIDNLMIRIEGETLLINLDIKASALEIKCNGQLKVEFAIETAGRRLVLPAVIYSGAQRYRYERRRETLSNAYILKPYHIYKGVRKSRSYELRYGISIPYCAWMKHAAITWREYLHDCSGDHLSAQGRLVADLAIFRNLVSFLVPEVEEVKARVSVVSLAIGFPVNVTDVRPGFGNNAYELMNAYSLVTTLQQRNELLEIRGVSIRGYASPEGSYANNERLARGRSEGFRRYLTTKFPHSEYIREAVISWIPEDWEGLGRLLADNHLFRARNDILTIVNDYTIAPDSKERMLRNIPAWSANYRMILNDLYPKLRRIELQVDYIVHNLPDSKARELIYTNPDLLSLEEIYRVASYYEPGSERFREVYEIAARQFPDDVVANNNAAAALLREGNAQAALPYLNRIGERVESLINFGAYWYITGEPEKAMEYWERARKAGVEQAGINLQLIIPEK